MDDRPGPDLMFTNQGNLPVDTDLSPVGVYDTRVHPSAPGLPRTTT